MRILEVVGLTKRFGGRVALDAVSFTAEEGQILALVGPRRAGKTTCGHCLSGVIPPDTGRIIFDGRELTGGDRHDLARAGLARTFQVTNVFPRLSAADNVAVGLGRHRFARLAVMLRAWLRASTRPQVLAILTRAGLGPALSAYVARLGRSGVLDVDASVAGQRFPARTEAAAYFCCTQALAGGDAHVSLALVGAHVQVEVTGVTAGAMDLAAVEDRVEALGGTLELAEDAARSGDVRLLVRLPVATDPFGQRPVAAAAHS